MPVLMDTTPQKVPMIIIRPAVPADVPTLATLFHETVMAHGPQHYTEAQTLAWAAATLETEAFQQFILGVQTYVAEMAGDTVGFGGLGQDGHIASLYVHQAYVGQGIGTAILTYLIEQAKGDRLTRLHAEASEFSVGLFQKLGFQQSGTEVVDRLGVTFTRYLVQRHL
ncbi:GNAT family N-acetyltransferase [Halomicronema sp. CCY15110]|uniref:GNAT family N-acetyltransferase n=1 Tax=Halomicronema sp. CCY15110 TaxID=2767773 RepID=UPI001EF28543|nr:GNAT family N-acetyltransferase [Halomicronema sp. CCY15110]